MKMISAGDLDRRNEEGPIDLIDVRTPLEFREIHVQYARNVPLDQLKPEEVLSQRQGGPDDPIYLVCKSGSRGQRACEIFHKAGFDNVVNVEGGILACEQANLPINRGRKAVSLERQVRIVAGSMIMLGVALGFAIHPGFHLLAGFVGAGLTFAGITDSCAMGMLIARMPWNQVRSCDSGSQSSGSKSPNRDQTPQKMAG